MEADLPVEEIDVVQTRDFETVFERRTTVFGRRVDAEILGTATEFGGNKDILSLFWVFLEIRPNGGFATLIQCGGWFMGSRLASVHCIELRGFCRVKWKEIRRWNDGEIMAKVQA